MATLWEMVNEINPFSNPRESEMQQDSAEERTVPRSAMVSRVVHNIAVYQPEEGVDVGLIQERCRDLGHPAGTGGPNGDGVTGEWNDETVRAVQNVTVPFLRENHAVLEAMYQDSPSHIFNSVASSIEGAQARAEEKGHDNLQRRSDRGVNQMSEAGDLLTREQEFYLDIITEKIDAFDPVGDRALITSIQEKCRDLGYSCGDYGPNQDGVDGRWGEGTRSQMYNVIMQAAIDHPQLIDDMAQKSPEEIFEIGSFRMTLDRAREEAMQAVADVDIQLSDETVASNRAVGQAQQSGADIGRG